MRRRILRLTHAMRLVAVLRLLKLKLPLAAVVASVAGRLGVWRSRIVDGLVRRHVRVLLRLLVGRRVVVVRGPPGHVVRLKTSAATASGRETSVAKLLVDCVDDYSEETTGYSR